MLKFRVQNSKYFFASLFILVVIISAFFVYYNDFRYEKEGISDYTSDCGEIVTGRTIRQDLSADSIKSFDLLLGTFSR